MVETRRTNEVTTTEEAPATTAPAATKGPDFTKYKDKEPTNLHVHYWDWIKTKTGVELDVPDNVAIKIVQIAVSAYQTYQASPENKQRRVDEAAEREAAAELAKAEKAKVALEKAEAKAKADAATASEAAAAGDGDAAKRQPPPKKSATAKAGTNKAAAGEAPF
jgi:hypothetical protein